MLTLVYAFLIFQVCYQSIVVGAGYGFDLIAPDKIAIIRDGLWLAISGGILLLSFPHWKKYFQHWGKIILTFLALLIFSVSISFFFFHKGLSDILIGIKYGLRYRVIFILAGGVGLFLTPKEQLSSLPPNKKNKS